MLTAEQQSALVSALELGSEVPEIGTGGWVYKNGGWERPVMIHDDELNYVQHHAVYPFCAESFDYDAACARLARWLRVMKAQAVDTQDGEWFRYPILNGVLSYQRRPLDCPDDELAAYVAACREVGK